MRGLATFGVESADSAKPMKIGAVILATVFGGGMAERTIATVLKTVEGRPSGGSNPPPSAN